MSELTEFLLERLADDEDAARAVEDDFEFDPSEPLHSSLEVFEPGYDTSPVISISRTRVLAECAAKRAIIAKQDDALDTYAGARVMDYVLTHMASVYKDHPGYRQEWVGDE